MRRAATSAALAAVTCLVACATFTPPAAAATCANESIREDQVSALLPSGTVSFPDCMALELVSPRKKYNQYAKNPAIAASGNQVRFRSVAALAETPNQGSLTDPYVATRTSSGWVTHATVSPPPYTRGYVGVAHPCAYTPDLSRWATWASTGTQTRLGITTAFEGRLGGSFEPLSPLLSPSNVVSPFSVNTSQCQGASADASRFFFSIKGAVYLPGDPASEENVYEAFRNQDGAPSVALLARDKDGIVYGGRCGAQVGGLGNRGSVSPDASLVYFSTRPSQAEGVSCNTSANGLRIMRRTQTPTGPEIAELVSSECTRVSPACSGADGDDVYQGASQDGARVLFITARQLADTDLDSTADLYLHDSSASPGERLTQLSAGEDATPGEGAEVIGVPDFAGDGSRAYFVAKGVLTTAPNEAGKSAQAGQPNLYLSEYPGGGVAFIATLASGDSSIWSGGPDTNSATAVPVLGADVEDLSVGGDGHVLVFASSTSLLSEDTDGGHRDYYRYDSSTASLELITKAAPGGSENGPFDVGGLISSATGEPNPPAANVFGEAGAQTLAFGRWVNGDGQTVVFQTKEALDPTDANGGVNAYLWRGGEVFAIPFGIESTLSMTGDSIVFTSDDQLLPEDGDGAKDIYMLRAGGGFPIVVPPPPCQSEACQGPPSPRPAEQGASSEAPRAGNPPAPKACRKGLVKRRGKCVKKHNRKAKNKRKGAKKRTGHNRGGRK